MTQVKCFSCDNAIEISDKDSLIPQELRIVICGLCWKDKFKRDAFLRYDPDEKPNTN